MYIQRVTHLYRPYGCFVVRFHQRQENIEGCQNLLSGEVRQIKPGLKLLIFIDGSKFKIDQRKIKKNIVSQEISTYEEGKPPSLLQQRD